MEQTIRPFGPQNTNKTVRALGLLWALGTIIQRMRASQGKVHVHIYNLLNIL